MLPPITAACSSGICSGFYSLPIIRLAVLFGSEQTPEKGKTQEYSYAFLVSMDSRKEYVE